MLHTFFPVEGLAIAVLVLVAVVALIGVVISRGGDRPIGGSGDLTKADAEARVRSSGIAHLNPGS